MIAKRVFDLVASLIMICALAPVLLLIAICIKLDSPGPVFFRQTRVGLMGRPFKIYKFRTMHVDAERSGPQITATGDSRITAVGRILRAYKLDELPQLLNALIGDMSLVGPRPEVPKYVAAYPEDLRQLILSVPPGITDFASIRFRDEGRLLEEAVDPELTYVRDIMPAKLQLYAEYVRTRGLLTDIKIIALTIAAVLFRR